MLENMRLRQPLSSIIRFRGHGPLRLSKAGGHKRTTQAHGGDRAAARQMARLGRKDLLDVSGWRWESWTFAHRERIDLATGGPRRCVVANLAAGPRPEGGAAHTKCDTS